MRKILLEEDDIIEEPVIQDLSSTTLITTLIKNSWDSVDLFNSVNLTLSQDINNSEVVDIIKDIVNGLYINIGQLEAALQKVNSQAEIIDNGKDTVTNEISELGEIIIPEEDIEVNMKG